MHLCLISLCGAILHLHVSASQETTTFFNIPLTSLLVCIFSNIVHYFSNQCEVTIDTRSSLTLITISSCFNL
ncbi:hypothetical protein EUGRSUZ_A01373 [Eucalyptus grandis]|uniref:Uncharacterized protein n=2 Tax=Eucalyptus grandis TaxID=71139 RepID=A0ACC3M105_EUCGR|nr:hypothetical protein EUGRSUZ_A01373 [Eucalyptus grandis]